MQRVKKSEIITLRVTPRIKKVIQEQAKTAGLTVTDYLCYSGLGKEIVRVEGLEQVLSELKAQGRNLNQLTTLANMGRVIPTARPFERSGKRRSRSVTKRTTARNNRPGSRPCE